MEDSSCVEAPTEQPSSRSWLMRPMAHWEKERDVSMSC